MRLVFFLLAFSIFSGCVANNGLNDSAAAEINIVNLSRLQKGMTQAEVLKIMRHPYDDAVFQMDGDTYDVWFYVTEPRVLGQSRMMPTNVKPLTFKNGILIGWGYRHYEYLKYRKRLLEEEAKEPATTIEKPKEIENTDIEQFLKQSITPPPKGDASTPSQTTSPQSTQPQTSPSQTPPPQSIQPKSQPAPQSPAGNPPRAPAKASKGASSTPPQPGPQSPAPNANDPNQKNWGPISPTPPQQTPENTPNWGPLDREPRLAPPTEPAPLAPPPPIQVEPIPPVETPQPQPPQPVSMAQSPKKPQSDPPKPPPKEEKYPIDEEDMEMLQKERMEDFDDT